MTAPLEVDTGVLRRVGSDFASAGAQIAQMHAATPLGDAAAGVPQLQTAAACRAAQTTIAEAMTEAAGAAHTYGSDLRCAADKYDSTDAASGAALDGLDIPVPR